MRPKQVIGAVIFGCFATLSVPSFAQDAGTLNGQIVSVDEPAGTITVKLQDGKTNPYKPQDGLVFNAVKPGDKIKFTTASASRAPKCPEACIAWDYRAPTSKSRSTMST